MKKATLKKIKAELEEVVSDKYQFSDTVVCINSDKSSRLITITYDGGGFDYLSMGKCAVADWYRGRLFAIAKKYGCYFEDYASYRMDLFLK